MGACSTVKRVARAVKKHGIPGSVQFAARLVMIRFAKALALLALARCADCAFVIKGSTSFPSLYRGTKRGEAGRILRGERKILFYDASDANLQRDTKVRWELNRMQHLPVLALSSADPQVRRQLRLDLSSESLDRAFEDTNAMEVSISAINVITACQLIEMVDAGVDARGTARFLKKCLHYIVSNLEMGPLFSNNHYFFNLLGALWITENIIGDAVTDRIRAFAYSRLDRLLDQILNADGSLYEGSTYYHRYVTDSLLCFLVLNQEARGVTRIVDHARRMYGFCCYASFGDRLIGLGDNDSGRVLPLPTYFDYSSTDLSLTHVLAGKLGFERTSHQDNPTTHVGARGKTSFGLHKLMNDRWQVAIRCDECRDRWIRRYVGPHYHNDQLALVASFRGRSVFVDSGVYSYVQDDNTRLRNLQTASHNAVVIDGAEQNTIYNDWSYTERTAIGRVVASEPHSLVCTLEGYANAVHRRSVRIADELIVADSVVPLQLTGDMKVDIYLHLDPDINCTVDGMGWVLLTADDLVLSMKTKWPTDVLVKPYVYSPEYGMRIPATVVVFSVHGNNSRIESEVRVECISGA